MVVVTGCFTRESFLASCQNGGAHAIWYAIGGSPAGKKMEKKSRTVTSPGRAIKFWGSAIWEVLLISAEC